MSRQKSPVIGVLHFFATQPIDAAEQALVLAKATVAARRPSKKASKPTAPKPTAKPAAAEPPAEKPPRRKKPQDVPLPGIQGPGPISTVGE